MFILLKNAMEFYDPNFCLAQEIVEAGLRVSATAFRCCRIVPTRVPGGRFNCNSLLYGKLGDERLLMFVRITLDDEQEDGTGQLPGVLIDAATELEAEPHVVRVHMRHTKSGRIFERFGHDEFVRHVRSLAVEWNASLIASRTVSDFRRLLGGHISQLRVDIVIETIRNSEVASLRIVVDGKEPYGETICPFELLRSARESGEHQIFTCSCGHAGCAGINRGTVVVREGSLVLWKAYYAQGGRIYLFDEGQYSAEIFEKIRSLISFAKLRENHCITPREGQLPYLEQEFFEIAENVGFSEFSDTNWRAIELEQR